MSEFQAAVARLTIEANEKGALIELGFLGLMRAIYPTGCPLPQLLEMRKAFFCGAHHLFASIMTLMDPGADVTEADLQRMDRIHRELEAFRASLEAATAPARKQ